MSRQAKSHRLSSGTLLAMLDQHAPPKTRSAIRTWWRAYSFDVVEAADAESEAYRAVTPPGAAMWRVGVVLVTVAGGVIAMNSCTSIGKRATGARLELFTLLWNKNSGISKLE